MDIKIRKGLPKDLAFIVQCQLDMAYETEQLRLDQSVLIEGVKRVFNDTTKGQYWVAEWTVDTLKENKLVGVCLTVPEWSDWRNGTVVWIHSVYTLPEARGKGVYKLLYRYLQDMVLQSNELRGLRLYVDKRNLDAMEVYKKMGMNAEHYALYEWLK